MGLGKENAKPTTIMLGSDNDEQGPSSDKSMRQLSKGTANVKKEANDDGSKHTDKDTDVIVESIPVTPTAKKRTRNVESAKKEREALREQQRLEKERIKAEKEAEKQRIKQEKEAEKQRMKEEKERKREEERQAKEEERKRKEEEKERERQEKEAEKEKQRQERENAKKQKELEKEQQRQAKEEEKRKAEEAKEAERRAKEEAKRAAEEERLKEQRAKVTRSNDECVNELLQEEKLEKQRRILMSFVQKAETPTKTTQERPCTWGADDRFAQYVLPDGFALAPERRVPALTVQQMHCLDAAIAQREELPIEHLYLHNLRTGTHKPLTSAPTKCPENRNVDLEALPEGVVKRVKYLLFAENVRPPYYGTWQQRSAEVNGRRPWARHKDFDYEYDSEAEWDEGDDEEGEECLSERSDEPDDDILPDEENLDEEGNPFFVPHGYLGEDELRDKGELDEEMEPEERRARMAAVAEAWKREHANKRIKPMRPLIIQPLWPVDEEENLPQGVSAEVIEMLDARGVLFVEKPITSYNWDHEMDTYESESCGDEEVSDDEATSADESELSADGEEDSAEAMEVGVTGEAQVPVKTT